MSAHTKGPWRRNGWELIGDSTVLATLHWHTGRDEQNAADARLIASAPRLLEALREQIETWVEFSRTELELCNRLGTINTPTLMRIFAARAAIYEATGEAP